MTDSATTAASPPIRNSRIVPLDARRHAGLGVASHGDHRWCAQRNAVPLTVEEFFRAALSYPIAWARGDDDHYAPMAILGLRNHENLFVDTAGRWRDGSYVPAFVRRFPFSLASVPDDAERRVICVDEAELSRDATPALLDAQGQMTASWESIRQLLAAIDAGWQQTQDLSRRIEALGLLAPFDAVAVPRQGVRAQLQGLYRIDEARLAALDAAELKTLLTQGELRAIYAHLLSLEQFGRLLELMQARDAVRAR
jgi:hypothetical protein